MTLCFHRQFIMARLAVLFLPLAFAMVAADVGYYIPKAFYTIDRFGHQSDPVPVPLFAGNRFKRSAFGVSSSASSSSSSSSNGFGQTQTFTVTSTNNNNPYDPYYNNNNPGNFNAAPVLFNRFGDEGGPVSGIGVSGTSNGGHGVYTSSSSTVGSDGKVHYNVQTGKF